MVKNIEYFNNKWQEQINSDDILAKVTAKRFIDVFANANTISIFDVDLYFRIIEKFVVIDKKTIKVCLLDGTEVECNI